MMHLQKPTDMAPVYPSVWFDNNARKPQIVVINAPASRLYHELNTMIKFNGWNDFTVVSYMAAVIRENPEIFRQTNVEPWNSFRIVIANANAQITPLDLLSIRDGNALPDVAAPIQSTPETRRSAFWALLMVYRKSLARAVSMRYGFDVTTRLHAFFQTTKFEMNEQEITRFIGVMGQETLTENYRKLIAAIDMFYFKFSNAEYSPMRIATLPARYKGCSAVTSFGQISRATGLTTQQLALFICTTPAAKEMAQISKTGQEANDIYGYFPYQLEMGVTIRSPYSLAANPTLYLWLHTIGSLMGFRRSIMAKMPRRYFNAEDLDCTVETAAAVVLHLSGEVNMGRQFATANEIAQAYRIRSQELAAQQAADQREEHAGEQVDGENNADEEAVGDQGDEAEYAAVADQNVLHQSQAPLVPVANEDAFGQHATRVLSTSMRNNGLTRAQRTILRQMAMSYRDAPPGTIGKYIRDRFTLI